MLGKNKNLKENLQAPKYQNHIKLRRSINTNWKTKNQSFPVILLKARFAREKLDPEEKAHLIMKHRCSMVMRRNPSSTRTLTLRSKYFGVRTEPELEVRGAVLLLVACGDSSFWVNCLTTNEFFFCVHLDMDKIILFKIF